MSTCQVGCAGIVVEDIFCGPMDALPAPGELLALESMPTKVGGCAANVAIDLAKQGIEVEVVGCLGQDGSAKALVASLEAAGVGCGQLTMTDGFPTSRTVILLVAGQDRRYVHVFGANRAFTVGQIRREWVRSLKVLYLGGLGVLPGIQLSELLDLLRFCREAGVVSVVDVVLPKEFKNAAEFVPLLPWIDYFLPNEDEARLITGAGDVRSQLRYFQTCRSNKVIITRGEAGALALDGNDTVSCAAYPCVCLDPSGAGDAFACGIIAGILRGWDLATTLPYASALGTSATRAIGTTDGVFSRAEAEAYLKVNQLAVQREQL